MVNKIIATFSIFRCRNNMNSKIIVTPILAVQYVYPETSAYVC